MDEGKGGPTGIRGEEQIESFARAVAIGKVEVTSVLSAYCRAASRPTRVHRIALGHGTSIVVRSIKLDAVHSAVQHWVHAPTVNLTFSIARMSVLREKRKPAARSTTR